MIDTRTLLPRLAVFAGLALSLPAYAQYSTPMRDVDNGARQPVNFSNFININPNSASGGSSNAVTVPAGKRLVIESISFQSTGLSSTAESGFMTVQVTAGAGTPNGATTGTHLIPGVRMIQVDAADTAIGGVSNLRMYADAGSQVNLAYYRWPVSANGFSVNFTITGHFVNLP